MIKRYLFISFLVSLLMVFPNQLISQFTPSAVTISEVKEVIGGKPFYLHTVKESQTLFGIARKYAVTTLEIVEANPEHPGLVKGINIGQVIRIPRKDQNTQPQQNLQENSEHQASITEKPALQADASFTSRVEKSGIETTINGKRYHLHTVIPGQTLFSIARAYGVSTLTIAESNPNHPDLLKGINTGQVIRIPQKDQNTQPQQNLQENSGHQASITEKPALQADASFTSRVEKSGIETTINGKRYHLHTVRPGQTLFSIARAYGVSTLTIAQSNPNHPELLRGVNVDQAILIPVLDSTHPPTPPISRETPWPIGFLLDHYDSFNENDCLDPVLKPIYNVALLIPLFLERFDGSSSVVPSNHTSFTFLPYYQGVLLALDSIRKIGANIKLHTFDLGRETAKAREIIQKPEMATMDLIIGPFYQEPLSVISQFAKEKGISVVSPLLLNNDQLINNPNLFQAVPSTQNQLQKLVEFLKNKYHGQNIILVHNNVAEVLPLVNEFKHAMQTQPSLAAKGGEAAGDGRGFTHGYFLNGTFIGASRSAHPPAAPGLSTQHPSSTALREIILDQGGVTVSRIVNSLDRNRNNVIVSLVGNELIVSNMMRELNLISSKNPVSRGAYNITLIGPARWEEFQSIDLRLFESLNVHIMSTDFVDYTHDHIRNFVRKFREVFNDEPNNHAFWGVKTAFLFFNSLNQYGRNFANCIERINREAPQPIFAFERFGSNKNGWVNSNLILYRINDFRRQCVLGGF